MNVKIVAIESMITMMKTVTAKPVSEKANKAILSKVPSANKSEGFYANIEQEALKLHNLSVKENTTLSPSSEKIYTKDRAPACWVRTLYEMGSIICIYSSESLKEISMLPNDVVRTIERYFQVLKYKNIYIRFFFACLEWEDEEDKLLPVSHVIRIATSSKHFQPEKSEIQETTPEDTIKLIAFCRAKGYKEQFEHIQKIIE
ncbi:Hypothetical predicted protein [Olea europaea subsp. europaea]|uniref:Uncharacterized protein n=1 Tax=Olea europaea subsp. europaea TaxID=158383 RepID=A0A8S0QG18_OLEEU|nr:Hypothetical predicted protein [Olea europaea subsp. europaea]